MTTDRGARLLEVFDREVRARDDHELLRREAAAALRHRVPYTFGIWATLDPLTAMWTSCVLDGFDRDPALERAVFANEYGVDDALKLLDLVRGPGAGSLSMATGGDLPRSARFRDVFEPMGVQDELRVVFAVDGTPWGALVLLSTDRRFDHEDIVALQALRRPFGERLRGALLASTVRDSWRPGTVLCAEDGTVIDLSPDAAALLGARSIEETPAAVAAAVARFRVDGTSESVVATGATWLSIRCAGLDGRVLVIVDRIDPHRLTDVLIAGAGLTTRERSVLRNVLAGSTARMAAQALGLSEFTVNDHLKRIFTKFGVGSRGELVAHLFTEHYESLHAAGAAPSARGHFLLADERRSAGA